jgi:hypothetical protein
VQIINNKNMACELSTGFNLDCKDGVGGVKQIILADYLSLNDFTFNVSEEVTAISGYVQADLFSYYLPTQTASFEETINFNRDNGTVFYTQTVNVMLHKLSASKRLELQSVAQARVIVFVLDANDNWWAVGYENGADLSTATSATGTALGDMNGYTLAFTHETPKRAYRLTDNPLNLV